MRYRMLGESGLRVSEIALGTMTFGTNWGFGAEEDEARSMVAAYAEAGGNFIDTANNYTDGTAERLVGQVVASDRERWVIGTKYTLSSRADDPNAAGNGLKNMRRTVEESLARLGTDYLDVLWVHAWDDLTPVEEVMRGLDTLVRSGKVLYIGISDAPVWVGAYGQALAHLRGWAPFIGMQVPWSLADRDVEREFIPMAHAMGMGVCAWGPLSGGLLSGKYATTPDQQQSDGPRRLRAESPQRLALARQLSEHAEQLGITSAQLSLSWLLTRRAIPIVGARTVAQLESNLASGDVHLEVGDLEQLDEIAPLKLGFSRGFLDSMTEVIHGPGIRARIDDPGVRR